MSKSFASFVLPALLALVCVLSTNSAMAMQPDAAAVQVTDGPPCDAPTCDCPSCDCRGAECVVAGLALAGLDPYRIGPNDVLAINLVKPLGTKLDAKSEARQRSAASMAEVIGQKLVGPDGAIDLGQFGQVNIGGKTVEEARHAIERQLSAATPFERVEIGMEMWATHSRQAHGAGLQDFIAGSRVGAWSGAPGITAPPLGTPYPIPAFSPPSYAWIAPALAPSPGAVPAAMPIPTTVPPAMPPRPVSFTFGGPPPGGRAAYVVPEPAVSARDSATPEPTPPLGQVTQVLYTIDVIEDREGCLSEFEELREGRPLLIADSRTMLPALRVMRKHNLVREIASPRLACAAGQTAELAIGSERPVGGEVTWQGIKVAVATKEHAQGLEVELAVKAADGQRHYEVQTAMLVEPGQTVVLNANGPPRESATGHEPRHPVYVVLTPELIK